MPFDQVRERQKSRGHKMPVNWIYSPSCARQEIEGAVAVIIAPRSVMRADACHHCSEINGCFQAVIWAA